MDGLNEYNNLLIIGMTNRIDLIDKALLRPGRFELHIEISLPNEKGRLEILSIHTNTMKTNNYLATNVNLEYLAKITKNYTGAELEGLVRNATSYALSKQNNDLLITLEDFMIAYKEMKPMFGSNMDKQSMKLTLEQELLINNIISQNYNTIGITNNIIADMIAYKSNISFITKINNYNFIGYNEIKKAEKLKNIFENACKCDKSMIIFENIEQILEYYKLQNVIKVSGILLNTLITLIKMKKIFIILIGEKITFQELNLLNYIDYLEENNYN
jgi:vesicle-fusing ATPase